MSFIVIIPARFSSSRLPGKPLIDIGGKPMIERVYGLAKQSKAKEVYVATDHKEIFDCCSSFGAKAVMTKPEHLTGTDRVAETTEILNLTSETVIVNLQGDEPFLNFNDIDNLAKFFIKEKRFDIGTLFSNFTDKQNQSDPNLVKLWVDKEQAVKGFSRRRDFIKSSLLMRALHIGVYVYKVEFIRDFVKWNQSENEKKERLEQLRALDRGKRIGAIESLSNGHIGIDTEEDLTKARTLILND